MYRRYNGMKGEVTTVQEWQNSMEYFGLETSLWAYK